MSLQSIADVSRTLLELLRAGMAIAPDRVALTSPVTAAASDIRIGIFLYKIVENPYLANENDQTIMPNNNGAPLLLRPPLSLTLHYLLTTYGSAGEADPSAREIVAHGELSLAMRIFYDNGILSGSRLRGDLAGTDLELRMSINPITMEDMTRIWSVFPDATYSSSVAYIVTPVPIESAIVNGAPRVIESDSHFGQARNLSVEEEA